MGNFLDLDELNILKITFRMGLEKFLWENLAGNLVGKSCGKILWEIVGGKSCRKLLGKNFAGNCWGKILWEILWEISHTYL